MFGSICLKKVRHEPIIVQLCTHQAGAIESVGSLMRSSRRHFHSDETINAWHTLYTRPSARRRASFPINGVHHFQCIISRIQFRFEWASWRQIQLIFDNGRPGLARSLRTRQSAKHFTKQTSTDRVPGVRGIPRFFRLGCMDYRT